MFHPGCRGKALGLDMFSRFDLKFSSDLVSLRTYKNTKPVSAFLSYYSSTSEFPEHPEINLAVFHYR